MNVNRDISKLHPLMPEILERINKKVIQKYNAPFRIFETARDKDRHNMLVTKGKTKDFVSMHLHDLENDPPLYASAVSFVYYDGKWSWNLRDATVQAWYELFGHLVLDIAPELVWKGLNRKDRNFTQFELRQSFILDHIDTIPCVTR